MIETLISSRTRIKLLLKFFLNSNMTAYLRNLESEFGESTNAIRLELNRFEQAGMLASRTEGNKKVFQVNTAHPLFREIHNLVRKYVGIDQVIEYIIQGLGTVEEVYLTGEFARGLDSALIDLIIVGEVRNKPYLLELVEKAEAVAKRRIRYVLYHPEEFASLDKSKFDPKPLLLWKRDA